MAMILDMSSLLMKLQNVPNKLKVIIWNVTDQSLNIFCTGKDF